MTTLEMMNVAKVNGKTYYANDLLYNVKFGFYNRLGNKWQGSAFDYLNDLFDVDYWKMDDTIYITKSEVEEKYGIRILE